MTNASRPLAEIYLHQWLQIRQATYDYLDILQPSDLALTLPFPESQSLNYQFFCMVGAHESYLKQLEHGSWQGFSSSISDIPDHTPALIKMHMQRADAAMSELLERIDLTQRLPDGSYGYEVVQRMIEHEMHHHGQLINFLFCHHLPIPVSWHEKWALARE